MQIAVIAKKGGVGKSTIAVLLQQAYTLAERAAAVMDWDGQGTSNRALDLIGGERLDTRLVGVGEDRCHHERGEEQRQGDDHHVGR